MHTWLGLTWPDWLVLAIYLVSVTAIGVWSMSRVNDMSDFFMGGRRFGKLFMMFFAFGSGTHSEQAVSVVAGTWRAGLAGIWWQFLWLWATPFYWIVAPILRRMRALTTSDFFEARFGTSTATLYSVFGMMIAITIIGGGLYGSGKMVNALTGGELDHVSERLDWNVVPQFGRQSIDEDGTMAWRIGTRRLQGYEIAILAITVLFVTYGLAGGLGAAIITDSIQGVLTIVFSFLLLPWVLMRTDWTLQTGLSLKPHMLDLFGRDDLAQLLGKEPITVFYVVMLSLTGLTGIAVQPHIMGVCGAGKTEMEGRFGFTAGNFIKRFCTIAWTFIGLGCIVWYLGDTSPLPTSEKRALATVARGDLSSLDTDERDRLLEQDKDFADELFGRAAYDILPGIMPGLVGLLLASLLASIMSTCDAQMVVASGLFTENIYKRFLNRSASQRHYLMIGRFAAVGIVVLSLLLQTTFTDVIAALKVIIKTPAAIGISLWFGIAWRRWNTPAVWVSSLTTFAVWWFLATYPDKIAAFEPLRFIMNLDHDLRPTTVNTAWMIFLYLSSGVLSGIVVSLLTPRGDAVKLDHFFRVMRTPVTKGEVVAEPCTLPANAADPVDKWFQHPDIELPRPTRTDLVGFAVSWLVVGLIVGIVVLFARI